MQFNHLILILVMYSISWRIGMEQQQYMVKVEHFNGKIVPYGPATKTKIHSKLRRNGFVYNSILKKWKTSTHFIRSCEVHPLNDLKLLHL